MQQEFPPEFQWLEDLARDVNRLSGFYKHEETAAIYCPHCEVIQVFCTGCGEKLIDVYDEATDCCGNCGISLSHCRICGHALEEQTTAPDDVEKPEYWKYCPACGGDVFAVTDMCPHCKVSMGKHLDTIYEATIDNVNQAIEVEERRQDGFVPKSKGKGGKIPSSNRTRWTHFIFGHPYHFISRHSYDYSVEKARQMTALVAPGLSPYRASSGIYRGSFRQESHRCFAKLQVKNQFWVKDVVSSVNLWLEDIDGIVHVTVEVNPTWEYFVWAAMGVCISIFLLLIGLPWVQSVLMIAALWILLFIYLNVAFATSKLKQYLRVLFDDISLPRA